MKHLLKLLADNRGRGFVRAEKGADEATVYLYDAIVSDDYWGGVSAIGLIKELIAIDAPVIHLRINSPGGDVFAARAIEQAIHEHPATVIAHIDGYAASAASYIALAADEVHIAPGGFFMIHKAWTLAFGNADDLMDTAALLEKVDESLGADRDWESLEAGIRKAIPIGRKYLTWLSLAGGTHLDSDLPFDRYYPPGRAACAAGVPARRAAGQRILGRGVELPAQAEDPVVAQEPGDLCRPRSPGRGPV